MIRSLTLLILGVLLPAAPAHALFFKDKAIVLDIVEATAVAPTNDGRTQVAPLTTGQTVDLEVFILNGGTGAMTNLSLAFVNDDLVFTDNFAIEGVSGLVSAGSVRGNSVAASASAVRLIPRTGYVATVTLRARRDIPNGTTVKLGPGTSIDDARFGGVDALDVAGAQVEFRNGLAVGATLDLDTSKGDQGRVTGRIEPGGTATIEIYAHEILRSVGFILKFEFDGRQVTFDSFEPGSLYPDITVLDADTTFTSVELSGASLGSGSATNSGLLGRARFTFADSLQGQATVRLAYAEFLMGNAFIRSAASEVRLSTQVVDFDGNGATNFRDFLLFAQNFGRTNTDPVFDHVYDLDRDGAVSFSDFVIVAAAIQEALGTGG